MYCNSGDCVSQERTAQLSVEGQTKLEKGWPCKQCPQRLYLESKIRLWKGQGGGGTSERTKRIPVTLKYWQELLTWRPRSFRWYWQEEEKLENQLKFCIWAVGFSNLQFSCKGELSTLFLLFLWGGTGDKSPCLDKVTLDLGRKYKREKLGSEQQALPSTPHY